jgi:hypothetical protein
MKVCPLFGGKKAEKIRIKKNPLNTDVLIYVLTTHSQNIAQKIEGKKCPP